MVWYAHLLQNFPQFIMMHTVKGFGIVNKAEIEVFLELSWFFDDPTDVGNLISSSSAFSVLNIYLPKLKKKKADSTDIYIPLLVAALFVNTNLLGWLSGKICLQCRKPQVRPLGREDPLEKDMATRSSILAWRIPGTGNTVHGITESQTRLRTHGHIHTT